VNVKAFFLILILLMAACRNAPTGTVADLPTLAPTQIPLAVTLGATLDDSESGGGDTTPLVADIVTQEPRDVTAYPVTEAETPSPELATPATDLQQIIAASAAVLPAPLYYIDATTRQVMRLERDGLTTTVITDEALGVEEFAVSAATQGADKPQNLVYESNNDLFGLNLFTGDRRQLFAGDKMSNDVLMGTATFSPLNAPTISPDGTQIAFAYNGIQLIAMEGRTPPTMILPNDPLPDFSDPNVVLPEGPLRQYFGAQWSPDGSQLAVEFAYFPEGGGVGLIDLVDGTFTDLSMIARDSGAIGCCEFEWIAPGAALLASDLVIYGTPGVARIDTLAKTVTPLITSVGDSDELPTLFRAPTLDGAGRTLAFVGELYALDVPASYFQIAQINPDGSTTPVHTGLFSLDQSVLWTASGDGVLVEEGRTAFPSGTNGGVRWVQLGGEEMMLPVDGRNFRWGVSEMGPLVKLDMAALRTVAAADFAVLPDVEIATRRILAKDQLLYIAYTIGSRSYDPPSDHMLGVYEYANGSWELLGLTPLGDDGMDQESPLGFGPDYLGDGSVTQIFIEPTNIWLFVSGGVGAHGGVAKLFQFDGGQLQPVAYNFNGSPFAGWAEDLNGDGFQELIFDMTDPYVFCYACSVRRVDFEVLRWDGSDLIQVGLTRIEGDEANNRAVDLAQASLWTDAAASAFPLRDSENEAARWNAYLIDLTSRYRALVADSPYPIMSRMFNGDYYGAVAPMVGLAPEVIFDINGELFAGTVADGWTDSMFPEIIDTTTRALAVKPDDAGAYFLRGWAKYFMNDATAVEDVAKSAELAPNNPTFSAARDYLSP
jgi:hypothetical protein